MDIQRYEIGLYDITSIPEKVRQEMELQRWRDIMAEQRYKQEYLPNFLKAEAEARESSIDRETFIRRKQALAQRWFGYYKKCRTQKRLRLIDQYNNICTMKQR